MFEQPMQSWNSLQISYFCIYCRIACYYFAKHLLVSGTLGLHWDLGSYHCGQYENTLTESMPVISIFQGNSLASLILINIVTQCYKQPSKLQWHSRLYSTRFDDLVKVNLHFKPVITKHNSMNISHRYSKIFSLFTINTRWKFVF